MENQTDKESISKRDIILNESFKLFLKKGYTAVSFSDLVEATHVSRGNMFHHFKNKEGIFKHVVDRFVFEFLTNDVPELLELTSSTPLKDFIDSRVENIGRRMKSFFMMKKGTVTSIHIALQMLKTDNLLDYSHHPDNNSKRCALFLGQWRQANDSIRK